MNTGSGGVGVAHILLTAIRIVTATAVMDQISREGRSASGRTPAECAEKGAVGEGGAARGNAMAKRGGSERDWAEMQPRDKEGRRREGQCKAKLGGS